MRLDLKDGLNAARVQRRTGRRPPKMGTTSRRGFGFPVQHLRGKRWFCLFEPIDVDVFTGVRWYGGGGGPQFVLQTLCQHGSALSS